jgi:aspartyl aminopeptidase
MSARKAFATDFLEFVNRSPTHFHAVQTAAEMLQKDGFQALSERKGLAVQPGGKYYFTRNQSAMVAVSVGKNYKPGNPFVIMAAHTDSPVPKVRVCECVSVCVCV